MFAAFISQVLELLFPLLELVSQLELLLEIHFGFLPGEGNLTAQLLGARGHDLLEMGGHSYLFIFIVHCH